MAEFDNLKIIQPMKIKFNFKKKLIIDFAPLKLIFPRIPTGYLEASIKIFVSHIPDV